MLPFGAQVGWEVPVGGEPTFLFSTRLSVDVATAADCFSSPDDPEAIADALRATWSALRNRRPVIPRWMRVA